MTGVQHLEEFDNSTAICLSEVFALPCYFVVSRVIQSYEAAGGDDEAAVRVFPTVFGKPPVDHEPSDIPKQDDVCLCSEWEDAAGVIRVACASEKVMYKECSSRPIEAK